MTIAYENLDLIPQILSYIAELKNDVELLKAIKLDLREPKNIQNFLEISRSTFYLYIEREVFKEGVHYFTENGKRIFITEAIIGFKKSYIKNAKVKQKDTKSLNNFIDAFTKTAA